jgi:hypothetical protein
VWVSDWGANAILRFELEKSESFAPPDRYAGVRQLAAAGAKLVAPSLAPTGCSC